MNERVRILRKELNLTLEKFGGKLGVKKNTMSAIETGRNNLTEQMIKSICREFNVNEKWLREGVGETFNTVTENERYAINVGKLQRTDNESLMRWVNAIAEADPDSLKEIEIFLKKILGIEN